MTASTPAASVTLTESIRAEMPELLALYRDLHAHPELSMQEVRTPALLGPKMRAAGFDVTEHVGKTGLVAVMKNGPGPVLLIRADMDALPVKEQTGLPFASTVMGKLPDGTPTPVMHACGHDTHIATWLGTARRLAAMKNQWSGTLVMILQPGEELVSRENDPQQPAVVTVGSFHSGTKSNIIPDEAKLALTVRSYTAETRKLLLDGINRIVRGEAIAAGMPEDKMPTVEIEQPSADATFNTPELSTRLTQLFASHFGDGRVVEPKPVMAAEDFSRYWLADKSKQSVIFWVGGVLQAKWAPVNGDTLKLPALHRPLWARDADAVISTATEAMSVAALDILKNS